jgi:hypothetical protein
LTGATGPSGGIATLYYVTAAFGGNPNETDFGEAKCPSSPAGLVVVGGGAAALGSNNFVVDQFPSAGNGTETPGHVAWQATVENDGSDTEEFDVYAICAAAGTTSGSFAPVVRPNGAAAQTVHPAQPVSP